MSDAPARGQPKRYAVVAVRALAAVALASFVGLLAYGLAAEGTDTTINDTLAKGDTPPAPPLRLPPLAGGEGGPAWDRAAADGTVELTELRGTPLAINFWASWCAPCETEAPVLEDAWRRARKRGVLMLGLNQQDGRSEARRFVAKHRLSFPQLRDEGRDTADTWGVTGLPETFFLTADGNVAAHVIGAIDAEGFDAGVEAAVAGRAEPARSGGAQGGRE